MGLPLCCLVSIYMYNCVIVKFDFKWFACRHKQSVTLTSLDVLLLLLRLTLSASSECLCWWRCSLARASSCSMMANCCSRSGKWKSVDCSQTLEKSVQKLELSFLSCTYLFQTVTVFQSFFFNGKIIFVKQEYFSERFNKLQKYF